MLVSLKEVLIEATENHRCIVAFNIHNFETAESVLNAAEKLGSPVILAFGERAAGYIPIELMSLTVQTLVERCSVPVVLHLDHAHDLNTIELAIKAGFTSVMYDGSKLPFEENLASTRDVAEIAHKKEVSVEAELGYVAQAKESGAIESEIEHHYTDPDEARLFTLQTKIEALAVSIGNVHGLRASKRKSVRLDLKLLERLKESCATPLVLHGGSGVPEEDLKRAVGIGIRKLNVNTELSTGAVDEIRNVLRKAEPSLRFEDLMIDVRGAMERIASHYIRTFTLV
jgi:ketose-bisphosphate aldolase